MPPRYEGKPRRVLPPGERSLRRLPPPRQRALRGALYGPLGPPARPAAGDGKADPPSSADQPAEQHHKPIMTRNADPSSTATAGRAPSRPAARLDPCAEPPLGIVVMGRTPLVEDGTLTPAGLGDSTAAGIGDPVGQGVFRRVRPRGRPSAARGPARTAPMPSRQPAAPSPALGRSLLEADPLAGVRTVVSTPRPGAGSGAPTRASAAATPSR